jgi:hypothetical protein
VLVLGRNGSPVSAVQALDLTQADLHARWIGLAIRTECPSIEGRR